tara:strand:- start:10 stop:213 length:204 start_codon:yes stop_codon:yes gene_type:complete
MQNYLTEMQALIDAAHELREAGTAGGWESDVPFLIGPPEDEVLGMLVAKDELNELFKAMAALPRQIV